MTRREMVRAVLLGALPVGGVLAQEPVGAPGTSPDSADRLYQPGWTGRARDTLTALDSDPIIIATERRMRCTCGCTLDIYTCRTTDFTCTFSPALHKEVIALYTDGKTPEQIIEFFVAREGEAILMAPPAEGFNVAGYVVPGLVMLTGALGLAAWITRRKTAVAAGEAPVAREGAPPPDEAALERLRRALDDVEA
jgi:cytochrome c-type biogenesis protein CcmH